jgi:hypothetical protein
MSNELRAGRAYRRRGCGSGVYLLVGPVAATPALGDRNPDFERGDTRSLCAAISRVALGGSRLSPSVHPPEDEAIVQVWGDLSKASATAAGEKCR